MTIRNDFLQFQAAILLAGALLGAAQVVILRRALALSGGDETVFGLTLTVWLLCMALGGALGSYLTKTSDKRGRHPTRLFLAFGLAILSLTSVAGPIILPWAAAAFGWIPGMVAGGGGLLLPLILSIILVGLSGGALFALGCAALSDYSRHPVERTYGLEAAGTFLGGVATTFIFLTHFSGLSILTIFAVSAAILSMYFHPSKLVAAILSVAILMLGMILLTRIQPIEAKLSARLHLGQVQLENLETPYGLLEAYANAGQKSVYENGLLLASSQDPATVEERIDLALAQHPHPVSVLCIGGSLGGTIREALRHPSIRRLQIVELNPAVFNWAAIFPDDERIRTTDEARVQLIHGDGRSFLQQCKPASYDLILLNLPGPRTARLSKFYTVEGFRLAQQALTPGGALVFSIGSSEDFVGPELASLLKSLELTLFDVFPRTALLPGSDAIFIAGDDHSRFALEADSIASRLAARGIQPVYWDVYRLRDRLSASRKDMLEKALQNARTLRLNRDRRPITFQMQQIFWSQQISGGWAGLWRAAEGGLQPLTWSLVFVAGLTVSILLWRRIGGLAIAAGSAVFFVGLTGLSLEILALIQYQVYFGSGYREVGLLVGLYMLGLAVGSSATMLIHPRRRFDALMAIQTAWILAPLPMLLPMGGIFISGVALARLFFVFYQFGLGLLGGLHFPLAMQYYGGISPVHAGRLYALDLLGALIGAILFGLFALPILGLTASTLQLTLLNLIPLLLLARQRFSTQHL